MAEDAGQEEERETVTFESLGLSAPIMKAITEIGYEAPTPIQEKTIPPMLAGRDLIGQAQTGTGQDGGVRPAHPGEDRSRRPGGPGAGARSHPRAGDPGGGGDPHLLQVPRPRRGAAGLRRPADPAPAQAAGPRRPRRRRHARPDHGPPAARARSASTPCASWCSTRRTRCSAWASSRTSSGSSRRRPARAADRALLGHHAARDAAHRRAPPARTRWGSRSSTRR